MTEDQVFGFARDAIGSVWALELLLVLRRDEARAWTVADLVLELRGSEAVIVPSLETLRTTGLVDNEPGGRVRYAAATEELDAISGELAKIYATRPMALAKAIMRAPSDKLRIFSDAFKFKD